MGEIAEVHLLYLFHNKLCLVVRSHSLYRGIEVEVLVYCQVLKDGLELWTIADQAASRIKTTPRTHIISSHEKFTIVRCFFTCQALECGGFSGTRDSKQGKALSELEREAQIINGFLLKNELFGKPADRERCLIILFAIFRHLFVDLIKDALLFFLWISVDNSEEFASGQRVAPILFIITTFYIHLSVVLFHIV